MVFILTIVPKPTVKIQPFLNYYNLGNDADLTCVVVNIYQQYAMINCRIKYNGVVVPLVHSGNTTFTLKNLTLKDSGLYNCECYLESVKPHLQSSYNSSSSSELLTVIGNLSCFACHLYYDFSKDVQVSVHVNHSVVLLVESYTSLSVTCDVHYQPQSILEHSDSTVSTYDSRNIIKSYGMTNIVRLHTPGLNYIECNYTLTIKGSNTSTLPYSDRTAIYVKGSIIC